MKFTLSWLKSHLDTTASLDEICVALTDLGLEVDDVHDRSKDLAPFIVGYVKAAEKHPNADKLRVCTVETGKETLQVVCGAPNARAGIKVVLAQPGAVIPVTGEALKKGVIRDVESQGMMCSARELKLGDDHDGIIELPESAVVGEPAAKALGADDPVIEIGLTPDRADCAGVYGIARDLAARGLGTLIALPTEKVAGTLGKSPISVSLDLPEGKGEACPQFVGRYFKGVKNGPSPKWLQDQLTAVGLRPISVLVDITNFFSLGLCRPLHVFDAAKLKGNIHARMAREGETLLALDGKEYSLTPEMTVIADDSGAVGLGGVMGGETTGVEDGTTEVFLEIAYFDPIRTANTGRTTGIISDARYRFERGVDPAFLLQGAELATRMILDLCGGETSDLVVAGKEPEWKRSITLRPSRSETLGGLAVPAARQKEILERLGFEVSASGEALVAAVPSWRAGDVQGEADLVEEVLRVEGFDKVLPVALKAEGALSGPAITPVQRRAIAARRVLAGRGMLEAVTWSFMKGEHAALFAPVPDALRLKNPISADLDVMRPTALGNLILAAGRNADRGYADVALFEVGPHFASPKPEGQRKVVAGIRAGLAVPRGWTGPARPVDAYDAKADAQEVLAAMGAPASAQVTTDAPAYYHPGRSAALRIGPKVLAYFGEIHPSVLKGLDVKGPVVAFEVFPDMVPEPKNRVLTRPLVKISPFQPLKRDFAFLVDGSVSAEKLVRAARGADKKLITDAEIFDVYTGKGVEEGKKSVALSITLQPEAASLSDEQIQQVTDKVIEQVVKQTGAALRG
ncbi:phenylalanine--tRNA ligase subunit beta [Radicibacter daui]|uniref:phenylalanine--tRNA ligase subunit beta n=1 Tax=Radicibacter daui TaxID=3064829 RepID=UPI004046955D